MLHFKRLYKNLENCYLLGKKMSTFYPFFYLIQMLMSVQWFLSLMDFFYKTWIRIFFINPNSLLNTPDLYKR